MEYQGVDTGTKELIFHQGPFKGGTNNIGEFLALVHALALLKKHNNPLPVYTDSLTARTWVKNKKVKTTIERNGIGFTGPDAEILTSFARQSQRRGSLSPKQMIILRRRIPAYARQIVQGSDTTRLEAAFSSTATTQAAEQSA